MTLPLTPSNAEVVPEFDNFNVEWSLHLQKQIKACKVKIRIYFKILLSTMYSVSSLKLAESIENR